MDGNIEEKVNHCYTCQSSRTSPARALLHPWVISKEPWHQIHMDYADYNGRNLLIVPSAHSKWIEIYLTGATNSTTTIEKLRCCFTPHGLPNLLIVTMTHASPVWSLLNLLGRMVLSTNWSTPTIKPQMTRLKVELKLLKVDYSPTGQHPIPQLESQQQNCW